MTQSLTAPTPLIYITRPAAALHSGAYRQAAYDIPLRCLIPEATEGLLLAGRCQLAARTRHFPRIASLPISVATGQAAGVCAGLAARKAVRVRDIDPDDVRAELRRQGAILMH